eukprot:Opistho-2@31568
MSAINEWSIACTTPYKQQPHVMNSPSLQGEIRWRDTTSTHNSIAESGSFHNYWPHKQQPTQFVSSKCDKMPLLAFVLMPNFVTISRARSDACWKSLDAPANHKLRNGHAQTTVYMHTSASRIQTERHLFQSSWQLQNRRIKRKDVWIRGSTENTIPILESRTQLLPSYYLPQHAHTHTHLTHTHTNAYT